MRRHRGRHDGRRPGWRDRDGDEYTDRVTGQIKLDASQLVALPSGHLWGWLLDEHDIADQDVPQKGPWHVPPFAVKTVPTQ